MRVYQLAIIGYGGIGLALSTRPSNHTQQTDKQTHLQVTEK